MKSYFKAPKAHAQGSGQPYLWHSRRGRLSRHLIILVALGFNACLAALALLVQWVDLAVTDASLPKIGRMKTTYSYKSLLAPGASLLGSINGFISGAAIASLITSYAKCRGLGRGVSFREIGFLSQLCESRYRSHIHWIIFDHCCSFRSRPYCIKLLCHVWLTVHGDRLFHASRQYHVSYSLAERAHKYAYFLDPEHCRFAHTDCWTSRSGRFRGSESIQYLQRRREEYRL
jgi:hypothetical protein